jgi:DNA-directed RNA polymerase subunit RPC12/RpoP
VKKMRCSECGEKMELKQFGYGWKLYLCNKCGKEITEWG